MRNQPLLFKKLNLSLLITYIDLISTTRAFGMEDRFKELIEIIRKK